MVACSTQRPLDYVQDVFADRCLCRVNFIFLIDVGRVVLTKSAVNVIHLTVGCENRVILGTTEQIVLGLAGVGFEVGYREPSRSGL